MNEYNTTFSGDSGRRCVIGIDGGGTKTAFALCSDRGEMLRYLELGPSNPATAGIGNACRVLAGGIDACMELCPAPLALFAGLAGKQHGEIGGFLKNRYPALSYRLESDAVNLLYTAGCGIGIICGTGSIVVASDGSDCHFIGGWGYMMGDPGSAFNIGREAVRTALAEEQGIGPHTAVTPGLRHLLGLTEGTPVFDVLSVIREKGVSYIASLAVSVCDAAAAGDDTALDILEREMKAAMHEVNTARRLYPSGCRVAASGGIITHNRDLLLPLMKKYALPDTEFVIPDLPPVFGACLAALSDAGITPDKEFAVNFRKTLHGITQ